jgi:hypothetical protein
VANVGKVIQKIGTVEFIGAVIYVATHDLVVLYRFCPNLEHGFFLSRARAFSVTFSLYRILPHFTIELTAPPEKDLRRGAA